MYAAIAVWCAVLTLLGTAALALRSARLRRAALDCAGWWLACGLTASPYLLLR